MDILLLIGVSFGASWLTFFCGFGLGTMLTPVFYLLFKDLSLAVAATAVVHLLNNLVKYYLMRKNVDWKIALSFGLPAIPAAILGALLLFYIEDIQLFAYEFSGHQYYIKLLNLIFGSILILFALIELLPSWSLIFAKKGLWFGGLVSGFFGGLSGHQGALRTAFLIKYQLNPAQFIATGVVIAVIIDIARSTIYFTSEFNQQMSLPWWEISLSLFAAVLGAFTGRYFLKKMKIYTLNIIVAIAMIVFGLALALGLLL
jgi:uncharacterized membrane protein YfcA